MATHEFSDIPERVRELLRAAGGRYRDQLGGRLGGEFPELTYDVIPAEDFVFDLDYELVFDRDPAPDWWENRCWLAGDSAPVVDGVSGDSCGPARW